MDELNNNYFLMIPGNEKKIFIDLLTQEVALVKKISENQFILDKIKQQKDIYETYLNSINSRKVITIWIFLTMNCDLDCTYCSEKSQKKHNNLMSYETIDKIILYLKRISDNTTMRFEVIYFGGEPLLNFNVIEYAMNKFNSNMETSVSHKIITNGYSLNEYKSDLLIQLGLGVFQITLDGNKEIHDTRRVTKNKSGTFEIILKNIKYMLKSPKMFTLIIRINVDKSNIKFIKSFLDKEEKLLSDARVYLDIGKVSTHNFEIIYPDSLSREDFSTFYSDIIKYIYKKGLKAVPPFHGGCSRNYISSVFISPEGYIYNCPSLVGITTCNKENVHTEPQVVKTKILKFMDDKCKKCKYLLLCGGGCIINKDNNKELHCNKKYIEKDLVNYYSAKYESVMK